MIPRFYDVQEGEVLVDGVNVKDYDRKTLRKKNWLCTSESLAV